MLVAISDDRKKRKEEEKNRSLELQERRRLDIIPYLNTMYYIPKCLLFHLENDSDGSAHIADAFKNCLHMIRYLNIESAKSIWQELGSLLRHKLFIDVNIQTNVALLIERCLNAYSAPAQEGKRNYLDSLYNCTNALYVYYNQIKSFNVPIADELESCVQKVQNISNYEIKAIWERSGEIRKKDS